MSTPVTSGRRIARRPRSPRAPRSVLGPGLVAVAAVLVLVSGVVEADPAPVERAGAVPVGQVSTACAAFPAAGSGEVLTLSAPLADVAGEGGAVAAGPVGGRSEPVAGGRRGALQRIDIAPAAAARSGWALGVTAEGGAAVGRGTFEVDRPQAAAAIAVQECLAPRGRWWFTGAGAVLDHTSTLVVANLDPGPAVIDVDLHGPDGVVDSVGTRGITLAPGTVRTIDLVDVAPQAEQLAVHVEASRGRVVAALADTLSTEPAAAPGREWIPAQGDPSRVLRLGPMPARADRRTLVVANPGEREALADVEVSGEAGTFVPTEVPQLRVPPGSVVTADLGPVLGGEAATVTLRSPVRLVGTVRSTRGEDVAYAAAAPLLRGPAAAVLPEGARPALHLTATEEGGSATVVAYSDEGREVDSAELEVAPAATLAWTPARGAAYLVVTREEGRLLGGVTLDGQAGLSQVVLRPLPVTLRQPVVTPTVR